MATLYGLTPRTADRLRQILADGGATGGAPASGAPARGVTWVQVTGSAGPDGWHPGVVSTDLAGTWTHLTMTVHVAAAANGALSIGRRYMCTRTGDATDGTPRFRTADDCCADEDMPEVLPLNCSGSGSGSGSGSDAGCPDVKYLCGTAGGYVWLPLVDGIDTLAEYATLCPDFYVTAACGTAGVLPGAICRLMGTSCVTLSGGTGSFAGLAAPVTITTTFADLGGGRFGWPIDYTSADTTIRVAGYLAYCFVSDPPSVYFIGTITGTTADAADGCPCGEVVITKACPRGAGDGVQSWVSVDCTLGTASLHVATACGDLEISFGPCSPPPPPPPPPPGGCCGGLIGRHPTMVIPDGPFAGTYTASPYFGGLAVWTATGVGPLGAQVGFSVPGVDGDVLLVRQNCGTDGSLTALLGFGFITGSGASVSGTIVTCGPPAVMTFPGTGLGSTGDITVTT